MTKELLVGFKLFDIRLNYAICCETTTCIYNSSQRKLFKAIIYFVVICFTANYIAGEDVTMLASMAKLKAGRLSREVADSCLQYWGGMGYTNETMISRFYRYV